MTALIVRHIKWIMCVAGLLTCTMSYAILAPDAMTQSLFGAPLSGPGADIVTRNWAVLITLAGGMLIYGAFAISVRKFVVSIVTISKCAFIILIIIFGAGLSGQLWISALVDAVFVSLFLVYLVSGES